MPSLGSLYEKNPKGKFKYISHEEPVEVVSVDGDFFWVKNASGYRETVSPKLAETGWAIHYQAKKEKYVCWVWRNGTKPQHPIWILEGQDPSDEKVSFDMKEWHRIEELDYIITTHQE